MTFKKAPGELLRTVNETPLRAFAVRKPKTGAPLDNRRNFISSALSAATLPRVKELFRERDLARIARCRTMLEDAGIETFLKNENVSNTEAWIMEFDPTLCVVNDGDFEKAAELIRLHLAEGDEEPTNEVVCKKCGEKNPGNFAACWNCEEPLGE